MKKLTTLMWLFVFLLGVTACDESDAPLNGYVETTEDGATTLVLKGYENVVNGFSVFQPDGFDTPFYIKDKKFYGANYLFAKASATRLDAMIEEPAEWQESAEIALGSTYWAKYSSLTAYKYVKLRVAVLDGNNVTIEYVITKTEERPNVNANIGYDKISTTNWEMPHLNTDNYYVEHYVKLDGVDVLNYAYEWNAEKKHSAWVAYSFEKKTCQDVVSRTDAWNVDPELPEEMQTSNDQHKSDGFDRGHICASEDRVYIKEANEQTFYYSNMSPQISSFNQGFWAVLEKQVQTWGRSIPGTYDKVYITKGGTLNQLLINFTGKVKSGDGLYPTTDGNGFTSKGLACPKYYFMAILSQKEGTYRAIGFLVEHCEDLPKSPTIDELKQCAVSIDVLEEKTGLDFFCNLPDDMEEQVESTYNENDWAW